MKTDNSLEIKELSDNRDRYIEQSKNTKHGQVAPLPSRPSIEYKKKEKENEQ